MSAARENSRRIRRMLWIARLSVLKLREGPVPFFRAVRRGLFDALPPKWKSSLARRRFKTPAAAQNRLALAGHAVDTKDLVTVVLPVFNQADMLAESIASVLAQTYAPFELIVLDDGSTDGIDAVLAEFAGDPRVRLLRQSNQKLPKALSNAFRFARGEFRTWTSADNLMAPEQLTRLVAFLREHPDTAMVYADYVVIGPDGAPLAGSDYRPHNRTAPDSAEIRPPRTTEALNVLQDNFIGACFLYRGWVGRALGPYSSNLGIEDYDYWMRINAGFVIEHLGTDELLYHYRWHDNSLSAKTRELKLFEAGQALMAHERDRAQWRAEPWNEGGKQYREMDAAAFTESPPATDDTVHLVTWTDELDLVFRTASTLRDPRAVHVTDNPVTAQALALFTERVFEAPASEQRTLALAVGDEIISHVRGGYVEDTVLPQVFTTPGRTRRILLQVDNLTQGGLERVMLDQALALRPHGFDCQILVCGEQGAMADEARELDIPVHETDDYAALLRELEIGLVLAHHSLAGAETARELGVPFVQTLHNTYHWFYPDEIERWRRADAATTAYVYVSANVAMYATLELGLDVTKGIVIENGVTLPNAPSTDSASELRRSLGLADDDYVLLNVASIYPPKAQLAIAHALAQARSEHPHLKVVLLGRAMDEHYSAELDQAITQLGLDGALIRAGFHPDTEPFYAMADAFLLPSYWEGCSLAVAEALLRGLPCVLADVGAARQQLRPGEGLIIDPPWPIHDLNFANLNSALATPRAEYHRDLADALCRAADELHELPDDPTREDRFGIDGVALRYANILAWLEDGGDPADARPWAWADHRGGELR